MKYLFLAAAYLFAGFYLYHLPTSLAWILMAVIVIITAGVASYRMFVELQDFQDLDY